MLKPSDDLQPEVSERRNALEELEEELQRLSVAGTDQVHDAKHHVPELASTLPPAPDPVPAPFLKPYDPEPESQPEPVQQGAPEEAHETKPDPVIDSFDVRGIAKHILSGKVKNVVCMVGAGISCSAGIPDFRTPGTGLYDNLQQYNLPFPEAVFEMNFFKRNPAPFFKLAKELLPGTYKPTITHLFLVLLHSKNLLRRCFTQNIDSLEAAAGLPRELVVAAHGNFDSASCIECRREEPISDVLSSISKEEVFRCKSCDGVVKPDIVFFGEALPERFFKYQKEDIPAADLAIVMGTSLHVTPFAYLPQLVPDSCPRLLINREVVGDFNVDGDNYRDAIFEGDCDDGILDLVKHLGWTEELKALQDCV